MNQTVNKRIRVAFVLFAAFVYTCSSYAQEVTITLTSKHLAKDHYFNGRRNVPYNATNIGAIYTSKNNYSVGVYANSYYRPTVFVAKGWDIINSKAILSRFNVGLALTGYHKLGTWKNPAYVLPMYSVSITMLQTINLQINHQFIGLGLTVKL